MITGLTTALLAAALQTYSAPWPTEPAPTVRQQGVPERGVPQVGVPQREPTLVLPGALRRGRLRPYRIGPQIIPFPNQFNLPTPAPGLSWFRRGGDAVLVRGDGVDLEVRRGWFG
jgi:hypothetical protein